MQSEDRGLMHSRFSTCSEHAEPSRNIRAFGVTSTRRRWLGGMAMLPVITGRASADSRKVSASSEVGSKSPPLQVRIMDGQIIEIHRQTGKVVLIDFMTTTCPSCKRASIGIERLYREFGGEAFLPVAVALDQRAVNALTNYRNLYGLTFPVGVAAREDAIKYLNHPASKPILVPTLVLLDKRGRISTRHVGWPGEQELRTAIARLLNLKM